MKRWLAYEKSRDDHTRVGFWPLLTDPLDYSGRGNHATPVNGCGPLRGPGMNGYYLATSGFYGVTNSQYLSLGNCTDLAFDNNVPWSISAWLFQHGIIQSGGPLLSFCGPTTNNSWSGWELLIDYISGRFLFSVATNHFNNEFLFGRVPYIECLNPANNLFGWLHVAVTYNGNVSPSGFRFYINGRRCPITWSGNIVGSWVPPILSKAVGFIGAGPSTKLGPPLQINTDAPLGVVRIVQAWKRELTGREVANRYAIEKAVDTFGRAEARKEFPLYLFVHGHQPIDSSGENPYLFLEGGGPSASIPLFVNSAQPFDSELGLDLFINGIGSYPSSIPLFIESRLPASGSIPLFLLNSTTPFSSTMNLFMDAAPAGSGNYFLPLSMLGSSGDFGLANQMPLFLEVGQDSSEWTSSMNLFTTGIDQGAYSTNMNLFVPGGTTQVTNSIPLSLWNSQSGNIAAMPLTCWAGPTGDPGSFAYSQSMNMFIDRPTDGFMTMYLAGDSPLPSSMSLYLHGSQSFPPAFTEVSQGLISSQFVTQGYGQITSLCLVLPNIVGSSYLPSNQVPFFVRGF